MESDRLNIAFIFYARPHLGGSGIMSMELAKELAKKNHKIDIVSYPDTFLTEEEKELGINIHPVQNIDYPCFKAEPYNATLASMVSNLYSKGNPVDIIHANYAITHGDAALKARDIIRRKGGNPHVVITSHGSDIHTNGYHELIAPALEQTLSDADALTFVSKSLQDEAREIVDLENYGEVIYNFVDEKKFKPATKQEKEEAKFGLELPPKAFVVYHASNFRPVKQTELLIESAKQLEEEGDREVYFLLVGDGPERDPLLEQVRNCGIDYRVKMIGRKDDVRPYIRASDVGVLCSKRESFGLALLEAMSCGLPGIGSNTGGIPEVINHGQDGYIFNQGDARDLTSYIKQMIANRSLATKLGQSARHAVETSFCRSQIVKEYESLYERTINQRTN